MAPELRPRKETPYSSSSTTKRRAVPRQTSALPLPEEFPPEDAGPPRRGPKAGTPCRATPRKSSAASNRSAKKVAADLRAATTCEESSEFQKSTEESAELPKLTEKPTELNKSVEESAEFQKSAEDLAEFTEPAESRQLPQFKQSAESEQSTRLETGTQEYCPSLAEKKTNEKNGRTDKDCKRGQSNPPAEYLAKLRKCAQAGQQGSDDEQEKKSVEEEAVKFDKATNKTREAVEETEDEDEDEDKAEDEEIATLFASSFKAHLRHSSNCSNTLKEQFTTDMSSISRNKPGLTSDSGNVLDIVEQRISRTVPDAEQMSWTPNIGLDTKNYSDFSSQLDIDNIINSKRIAESMWKQDGQLRDGLLVPSRNPRKLNKLSREQAKDSVGAKWFDLVAPTMTPELKKDLQLLKLRGAIDPKRHYKAEDSKALPKYFQVGTVVEGPADFYSGRLTKRQRKTTLADELLSDSNLKSYRKKKYLKIQDEKQAGGKKFWKQKKNKQKPSWAKT